MSEFFKTRMGHQFFEGTLPRLVKAVERLAVATEKANEQEGPKQSGDLSAKDLGDVVDEALVQWMNSNTNMELDGKAHQSLRNTVDGLINLARKGEQ